MEPHEHEVSCLCLCLMWVAQYAGPCGVDQGRPLVLRTLLSHNGQGSACASFNASPHLFQKDCRTAAAVHVNVCTRILFNSRSLCRPSSSPVLPQDGQRPSLNTCVPGHHLECCLPLTGSNARAWRAARASRVSALSSADTTSSGLRQATAPEPAEVDASVSSEFATDAEREHPDCDASDLVIHRLFRSGCRGTCWKLTGFSRAGGSAGL